MNIKLYVEGGGKGSHKVATIKLQQGFNTFFRELKELAREKKINLTVLPSGNTQNTYEDFLLSHENSPQNFNLLLVDSDDALAENETPRTFLQKKYKKWKLQNVKDEQCHLMVRIMESWFIADVDALKNFYGQKFSSNSIPKSRNVETIEKPRVLNLIKTAIFKTNKNEYHKIEHGAKILEKINPQKVREVAPHCRRLFETILDKIEPKKGKK